MWMKLCRPHAKEMPNKMKQTHEANEIIAPPARGLFGIPLSDKMVHGERELRQDISKQKVENGPSQRFNTSRLSRAKRFSKLEIQPNNMSNCQTAKELNGAAAIFLTLCCSLPRFSRSTGCETCGWDRYCSLERVTQCSPKVKSMILPLQCLFHQWAQKAQHHPLIIVWKRSSSQDLECMSTLYMLTVRKTLHGSNLLNVLLFQFGLEVFHEPREITKRNGTSP